MAQVVRPQGIIGPIVLLVVGAIVLLNAVPAAFQWIGWIAQSSFALGVEGALETALVPLGLAVGATFVGFLMVRGAWGSLRRSLRGASRRAYDQARSGVQGVRDEAERRYADTQAQMRRASQGISDAGGASAPQSWRDRIEAVAREAEAARQQRPQQAMPGQQQWQPPQQPAQPRQPAPAPQQRQPQQAPGSDRLARIEQLRRQVDERARQARGGGDARQQAQRAAAEAQRLAERAASAVDPSAIDAEVAALVGRLDVADAERMRRRGSSLTSSSLTTGSLARTSLTLNSLLQHRR
ncbi:hypothetical protein OVA14_05955 [Agrococcus sp. SL85]|uniref:hypothetical protein n=1 Tax=Agrococcus sp. SL85 TaxID=2995141 RepID=UPI00226CA000|nr:hypothetical protein [Agrococcus sp. SL85]WAC67280.1 hypothetical protein OVA14_05955 [Agrococcus sp. SL85]